MPQHESPAGHLADTLRAARQDRGWTQHELADRADVSRPTIARLERGQDVSVATLTKVATSLDLRVELLPNAAAGSADQVV